MRKLFVYHSFTGNVDEVAKFMSQYGYETYRVNPRHEIPSSFFWSMMVGGFESGINKRKRVKEFKINPDEYDEIVVGSPIWNGKLSSVGNTIVHKLRNYKGKIRFVLCSGSGEGKKATIKISKMFSDTRSIILKEPKKHSYEYDRLKEFLSK